MLICDVRGGFRSCSSGLIAMVGCVWVKDTMLFHGADTDNAPGLDRIRMTISHHSNCLAMLCFQIVPTLREQT
jgi:hypothetical protein